MRQVTMAGGVALALLAQPVAAAGLDEVQAGNAAFGAGRYEAAVEAFTRGVLAGDLDPAALAIALNNRGVAYGELGDLDRAISDYQEALKLQANDPTAIKNLRIAHIRRASEAATLGETDAALSDYGQAIALDPQHPLAYLRRAQLRLAAGDVAAVQGDLEIARRLDPDNRDVARLMEQAERALSAAAAPPPAEPAAPLPPGEAPPRELPPSEPAAGPAAPTAAAAMAEIGPDEPGQPYRTVADVNVRSGPGNEFRISGALARGAAVDVLGERLGWLRIRVPGGQVGFVYRKWLVAVDAGRSP